MRQAGTVGTLFRVMNPSRSSFEPADALVLWLLGDAFNGHAPFQRGSIYAGYLGVPGFSVHSSTVFGDRAFAAVKPILNIGSPI